MTVRDVAVTVGDDETASSVPGQVTGLSASGAAIGVTPTWTAPAGTVLGYLIEVSYDGGATWTVIEDDTASTGSGWPSFGGRYTMTPAIGIGFTEAAREYIHSWRQTGARRTGLAFGLDVEAACRYAVSYRDLEAMMTERGVAVDHSTIYRWVQRFVPEMEKRLR